METNAPNSYLGRRRRFWTVLDKMMALDLLKVMLTVLVVIVLILVSQQFIKILGRAIQGEIANDTVMSILALKTILVGINLLPAASFMAILIVLGRMYRDHEMDALASAGVGLSALYQSVFILIIPISIAAFFLAFITQPWAESKITQLKYHDQQTVEIRGLIEGRFQEYQHGEMVFYIESIDADNRMSNIFVQHQKQNKLGIITAKSGALEDFSEGRFIVLENGQRIQGQPGEVDFIIEKFDTYAFLIKKKEKAIGYGRSAIGTVALWLSGKPKDWSEIQQRLAIPLGILILSLLAVPLAQLAPRGGLYGNIAIAFLIYFSYENIQKFSQSWVLKELLPIWLSFVWVYLLMLLVLLALMVKFYGREWVFKRKKKSSRYEFTH